MTESNAIKYLYHVTRAEAWKDTKLNWIFIALSIILLKSNIRYFKQIKLITFYPLLTAVFFTTIAITNDYADKKIDRQAGKNKVIHEWDKKKFLVVVALLFLSYSFLTLNLSSNISHFLLSLFLFVFGALGYSLKPLRFKERGGFGVFIGGILRTIPLLLLFLFQESLGKLEILFLVFVSVLGFRQMFIHQIKDIKNDLKTKTITFVTKISKATATTIMLKLIFPVEISILFFLIFFYGREISRMIYLLVFIYGIFWISLFFFKRKVFSKINQLSTTNSFFADFYFL